MGKEIREAQSVNDKKMSVRMGRKVLKRFRLLESNSGERLTRRMDELEVKERRCTRRPCTRLLNEKKSTYNATSLELRDMEVRCMVI